ncbi:hypothetical protein BG004_005122 [Podila humilis]|nr:hypothetical protein BG004_005122 [Podila humilis]
MSAAIAITPGVPRPRAGSISTLGTPTKLPPSLSSTPMSTMYEDNETPPKTTAEAIVTTSTPPSIVGSGSLTVTTPTTPSPLRETTSATELVQNTRFAGDEGSPTILVKCQCPPLLDFPENVKREMKRDEEEHRQRECGLYAKIIELQIEVANLKGEKDSLSRIVCRRDKMLLELQVQLQAIEFVCRENNIKVDVDMCPDEAIENWSFKESDEVYQRIVLTTQELLRNGTKCLEEGMATTSRVHPSSRTMTRISAAATTTASSFMEHRSKKSKGAFAGISAGIQPLHTQDQDADPLVFKETSRPGTLKFDMQSLLRSEQEFQENLAKAGTSALELRQVNSAAETGPRRALDIGDNDRSGILRNSNEIHHDVNAVEDDDDVDDDDDDDEGQESEFEELGEDMIKYIELQSSMTPRRESRSSSFSKPGNMIPALTPDMSTAVLMKNTWSGSRRNTRTTPIVPSSGGVFSPSFKTKSRGSNRGSSSSSLSSNSISSNGVLEDYFHFSRSPQYDPPLPPPPPPRSVPSPPSSLPSSVAPVGLGIGMGMSRSPEQPIVERFVHPHYQQLLSAPPVSALPPSPLPHMHTMPHVPMSSPSSFSSGTLPCSYYDHTASPSPSTTATCSMVRSATSTCSLSTLPPPSMPLPPLPAGRPRYSYRDHTKSKLLESRRPTHGRTCSHGFAIENVGQFLKRKTFGKLLTRETMYRGHRRRDSV